jgi:hypothetical protein
VVKMSHAELEPGEDAVFHREESGGDAVGSPRFVVDVLEVMPDRVLGNRKAAADLSLRKPLRRKAQDFDLALTQAGRT